MYDVTQQLLADWCCCGGCCGRSPGRGGGGCGADVMLDTCVCPDAPTACICGGCHLWSFVVVCGGLRLFVVVCSADDMPSWATPSWHMKSCT